jgi:hypothetical protein
MKWFVVVSQVLWCTALPGLLFAGSFEGSVTGVHKSSSGEVRQDKLYFKGDRLRVDDDENSGYSVWDLGKKQAFSANPKDKTVFIGSWDDFAVNFVGKASPQDVSKDISTVTKTGKSDKVAGYSCEMYHVKDNESSSEVCVAKGISNSAFYQLFTSGGLGNPGLRNFIKEKDGGFPLRSVNRDESGQVESTEEVTKIEAAKLDDSLFEPPAGFKRTNYGDAMREIQLDVEKRQRERTGK